MLFRSIALGSYEATTAADGENPADLVDGEEPAGGDGNPEPAYAVAAAREPRRIVPTSDDDLDVPDFLK